MSKPLTEHDLRLPEFRHIDINELEWDGSGECIVRKDRWEMCTRAVVRCLGHTSSTFDVAKVKSMIEDLLGALTKEDEDGSIPLMDRLIQFKEVQSWRTPSTIHFIHEGQLLEYPPEPELGYRIVGTSMFVGNINPDTYVWRV